MDHETIAGDRDEARSPNGKGSWEPERIDPITLRAHLEGGQAVVFVDSRPSEDWNAAYLKLPGAIRVAPGSLVELNGFEHEVPEEALIIVYCTGAYERSSAQVARALAAKGYMYVGVLSGGFEAWRQAKGPLSLR